MKPNFAGLHPRLRKAGKLWQPGRPVCGRQRIRWPVLALWLGVACGLAGAARAADYGLTTSYENYWFTNTPSGAFTNYFGTNASAVAFGGHVLGNTNDTLPNGGGYGLEFSSFGQPVVGIISGVAIGDVIVPPLGATSGPPANFIAVQVGDNPAAYYECTNPAGSAFWVPSTGQVIAAQPNNLTIDWRMTDGSIKNQLLTVSAVPSKRPARLFWTESPYDSPKVDLSGLFPVIHYNSGIRPPAYQVTAATNGGVITYTTNILSGVW